jgi:ankyrin repeat protein
MEQTGEKKLSKKEKSLLKAAQSNDLQSLLSLIQQKISLECRNFEDCTPLMLAARKNSSRCITALLENGANVHTQDKRYKNTALIEAVFAFAPKSVAALFFFDYKNKHECLQKLLQTKNRKGATAVSIALENYNFYSKARIQLSKNKFDTLKATREQREFQDIINRLKSIINILKNYREFWSQEDQQTDDNYKISESLQ